MNLLITFLVALIGALVAMKLKIPAGAMVGSMIAVAIFNIAFDCAYFPRDLKTMTQIISGLFIGCKITKYEIVSLKKSIKPAIINTVLILLSCLLMGVILYLFTDYSLATCTFATAPGSMVDMSIISMDMGADTSVVSVLQLVRLVTILCLFPTLFGKIIKLVEKHFPQRNSTDQQQPDTSDRIYAKHTKTNMALTLLIAIAFGLLGYATGIPAGALIFSMFGVALQNVFTTTAYMPYRLKQFAQVCAGALIGESVTRESVISLRHAIVPAIILMIGLFIIILILSFILYKTSDLDFTTALFSCAPGGASDLALIAEDFGANTPKVSIIQTMRVVCVVVFYPTAIQLINELLG